MNPEAFVQWAMDDARTVEERYCVELLIEQCYGRWKVMHNQPPSYEPWQKTAERKRQRKLNPAYEPRYTEEVVRRITEVFPEVKTWHGPSDDRVLRDFKALTFLPNLVDATLHGDFSDLSPLLEMRALRKLAISSSYEDSGLIGQCHQLRELNITFGVKWPEVKGLERLTQLEVLTLKGNLLAFEPGVTFPRVVRAAIHCEPLAARNMRHLPQLPACRLLTLSGVDRLDGIEAFSQLRNLRLECDVKDFAPLAALPELTAFSTSAAQPADVSPLIRVPKLAYAGFNFRYQFAFQPPPPRDYSPLVEAPALRELEVPDCPPVATEVAAINAALPPWSDLFALPEPRALSRLRIHSVPMETLPHRRGVHLAAGETEPIDEQLRRCEARWVARQITQAVTARVGFAEWGKTSVDEFKFPLRTVALTIECYELVEKFGLVFEAAREALARVKEDWYAFVYVDLKSPKLELTREQKRMVEQFRDEQDDFDFEQRKKEWDEFIDRVHRYQIQKQDGRAVDPAKFAAPAPEQPPPAPWEREDEEDEDEDEDESGETGLAVKKKKPEPPPDWDDDEHPLAGHYRMWGILTHSDLWISGDPGLIRFTTGREPDDVVVREKK